MSKIAEVLMQLAIDAAKHGIDEGQTPFGCAIRLADGRIIAKHNTVLLTTDITAHAEINAIREANHSQHSIHLENAIVASTCEPCPMCMAALHWARVRSVYFGATIADAAQAGFNEMKLPAEEVAASGGNKVGLDSGILTAKCRELFDVWRQRGDRVAY